MPMYFKPNPFLRVPVGIPSGATKRIVVKISGTSVATPPMPAPLALFLAKALQFAVGTEIIVSGNAGVLEAAMTED